MSFQKYAKYYDALNSGKDYESEIEFIHRLIQFKNPGAIRILDIGCGTGKHASLLSKFGYEITCIDLSGEMISIAKEMNFNNPQLTFYHTDIIDLVIDIKFDIIISLFHVVSYFVDNNYVVESFRKINDLLNKGGYFMFDCWDGNGVLGDLPKVRHREFNTSQMTVNRVAKPTIDLLKNTVNVNFEIKVIEKDGNIVEFDEQHNMRYFFPVEISLFCTLANFCESKVVDNPFNTDWYSFYICEKK